MKKLLTIGLIASMLLPQVSIAKTIKQATLIGPKGQIVVVIVGTDVANDYLKLHYKIYKKGMLGAVVNQAPSLFETSLATAISNSATSMTLVSGKTRDGLNLSGNICFTIDSGLTTTEFVCGVANGTSITSMTRGIGPDGVTSTSSLRFPHRYGSDVKVTDFPVLQQYGRLLNGQDSLPNVIRYSTSTVTATSGDIYALAPVDYVNNVAINGAPNAAANVKGITKLSSSPASSTNPIALNSEEVATTSGANKVVRASSTGYINQNFLDIFGTNNTWTSTSTFASGTVFNGIMSVNGSSTIDTNKNIGGGFTHITTFTNIGTSTWTKPTGVTRIRVKMVGGGGAGGFQNSSQGGASGGGGGGYCERIIDVSLISTTTVVVGSGAPSINSTGTGGTGSTTSFGSYCSATGGTGGMSGSSNSIYGGNGGIGSNGDINIRGGGGQAGISASGGQTAIGGGGGSSMLGGGGAGVAEYGSYTATANDGGVYGGGGSGGVNAVSGAGAQGIVIVEY